MTVAVEELAQDVGVIAPGIPGFTIARAVLTAAGRFCKRTSIWRAELNTDFPIAGFSILGTSPPQGSRVIALLSTTVDDRSMELAGDELLEVPRGEGRARRVALSDNELHFDGMFSGGETVAARGALEPLRTATTLPDILGIDWREAMIAGAASEVMRYVGVGRSDDRKALMHEARFQEMIAEARARSRSGWTHAKRTVSYGGI